MPRPTRSKSRTNPDFDPSELADLIYTPAVGTGVSSHLIDRSSELFPAPVANGAAAPVPDGEPDNLATVVKSPTVAGPRLAESVPPPARDNLTTVAEPQSVADSSTVAERRSVAEMRTGAESPTVAMPASHGQPVPMEPGVADVATVVKSATVGKSTPDTVAELTPVDDSSTEVDSQPATVDGFPPAPAPHAPVWLTEDGLYLPPAKVRRIRLAQDALSAAEEMVYDLLWSQKPGGREEAAKTVQAGYDFIMKRTRLSKKTVQRIIDKLIDKGFIEIETPADIYRRTATTYRVFNYKTILERQAARNRFYVAKIGPGMVYVRQVARPSGDMTTVVSTLMSTVADSHTATVDKPPTVGGDNSSPATVARRGLTTVVRRHTPLEEQTTDKDGQPSSSDPVQALVRALAAYGPVDDDGARYLLAQCRRAAPDCTGEEILHFIEAKGEVLRLRGGAVRNAVGFLLSAVPKCFSGETLRIYREEVAKEREQRLRLQREAEEEVAALRAEQEGILNDPASSEEDRRWARRFLEQGW